MIEIPLTQNQVAFVSDEDADLAELRWSAHYTKNYANGGGFRARRSLGNRTQFMHRVVLSRMLGKELVRSEYADHINHNALDNRRENLRLATAQENSRNRRLPSNNVSGFKGVYFNKDANIWYAQIYVDAVREHLGIFDSDIEAALAYDRSALKYFGDFAFLNFPASTKQDNNL